MSKSDDGQHQDKIAAIRATNQYAADGQLRGAWMALVESKSQPTYDERPDKLLSQAEDDELEKIALEAKNKLFVLPYKQFMSRLDAHSFPLKLLGKDYNEALRLKESNSKAEKDLFQHLIKMRTISLQREYLEALPQIILERYRSAIEKSKQDYLFMALALCEHSKLERPHWLLNAACNEFWNGEKKTGGRGTPRNRGQQMFKDLQTFATFAAIDWICSKERPGNLRKAIKPINVAVAYMHMAPSRIYEHIKQTKDRLKITSTLEAWSLTPVDFATLRNRIAILNI